jgi:hypothetical protein
VDLCLLSDVVVGIPCGGPGRRARQWQNRVSRQASAVERTPTAEGTPVAGSHDGNWLD